MISCLLLIAYLKMTYFIIFADLCYHKIKYDDIKLFCDIIYFVNCVFENDIE